MQQQRPLGLNHLPAFRRARLLIAELCETTPAGVDERLRHLALQVPNRLVYHAAHRDDYGSHGVQSELHGAALQLCQEIERAGENGELPPARYQRLRHLSEELLDVC